MPKSSGHELIVRSFIREIKLSFRSGFGLDRELQTRPLQKLEDERAQISDSLFWFEDNKDSGDIKKTVKVAV